MANIDASPQIDNQQAMTTIAEYITTRLDQLQVYPIFGVAGDYLLTFLDYIEQHPRLQWVGNTNELNASYAADGYSRAAKSMAALVTTQGVGELSAINGVAGALAERIPIFHIVGVASTEMQQKHAILHHTLGEGTYSALSTIESQVTAAQSFLKSPEGAGQEIDRLIMYAISHCKPVYLALPSNLVKAKIPSEPLNKHLPLDNHLRGQFETNVDIFGSEDEKKHVEEVVIDEISKLFKESSKPIVIVDACAIRYGVEKETKDLIEMGNIRFFDTPMGKGAIDESHPNFGGTYIGGVSVPQIRELAEDSDLVINVGAIASDFNTGSWSGSLTSKKVVELHSDHTRVGYARYPGVAMRSILPRLSQQFKVISSSHPKQFRNTEKFKSAIDAIYSNNLDAINNCIDLKSPITQDWFWPRFGKFFKEGDIILTETGTSSFGILDLTLPKKSTSLSQVLWGSIGWTGGAVLGAAIAAKKQNRRCILFIGDGSLLLTIQEIATLIRYDLKPIIVVLSNDGYEIERCIHGENAKYNDIPHINHQLLLNAFSPPPNSKQPRSEHSTLQVKTKAELNDVLNDDNFSKATKLQLLEVILPRHDSPRALKLQASMSEKANA